MTAPGASGIEGITGTSRRTAAFMGWRPDLPDVRDYRYMAANPDQIVTVSTPPMRAMDLRIPQQPVFDQGPRGSCTGQSTALLHAVERKVTPRSALFTYFKARELIGETDRDEGAYIRDAIKTTNTEGVPRDDLWPDDDLHLFGAPSLKAETDAEKRKVLTYYRLDSDEITLDRGTAYRLCLASGHAFVIGFTVYGSFWQAGSNGGVAYLPVTGDRPDGGHAVVVYGYDDAFRASPRGIELIKAGVTPPESVYYVRNSWSREWGWNGDFVIDTRFFDNPYLADDAWTIRKK